MAFNSEGAESSNMIAQDAIAVCRSRPHDSIAPSGRAAKSKVGMLAQRRPQDHMMSRSPFGAAPGPTQGGCPNQREFPHRQTPLALLFRCKHAHMLDTRLQGQLCMPLRCPFPSILPAACGHDAILP